MMNYDPEAASIFMRQALKVADPRWQASQGQGGDWSAEQWQKAVDARTRLIAGVSNRINSDEGTKPEPPYIKWKIRQLSVTHAGGRGDQIKRELFEVTVFRLDVFLSGQGSFNGVRQMQKDLQACLIGVPCTPIRENDTGLAKATMSRYRKPHRRSYVDTETKALVTEYGIVFELALEPFSL